jgi:hypothetical protein
MVGANSVPGSSVHPIKGSAAAGNRHAGLRRLTPGRPQTVLDARRPVSPLPSAQKYGNLTRGEYCAIDRSCRERSAVIGVSVVFDYDGDFDRGRVLDVAKNARGMFEGLPGLRFKFFTLDEKQQRVVNIYIWESKEAAEAFFTEELTERVTGLYGAPPVVGYLEIAEFVDNS